MSGAQRIRRLQDVIAQRKLAGAILFYSRDVFYYTGTAQPAYLAIRPDEARLFVRRGYETALRESWFEESAIADERSLDVVVRTMFTGPASPGGKIGTELDVLTIPQARALNSALRGRGLFDISPDILGQRMKKEDGEVESTRKACAAVHAGHLAVMSALRPGISELELAASVENAHRLAGHEGCFFLRSTDFVMSRGPLASGDNLRLTSGTLFTLTGGGLGSAVPTGPTRRVIREGDLVLVDIPTCVEGYHADQSRTYSTGKASGRAVELFQRLREVADFLIGNIGPGTSCKEMYGLAFRKAEALGLKDSFMRFDNGATAHFIGHGTGLEINEPPLISARSNVVLTEKMTLALELHVMEPGGYTMKLEDTLLVSNTGAEILTPSPRELIQVTATKS
ncbi:MAG: Xaa-Pro peptidase family protein [Syntrophobacteraceae bacterium]